ncbi:MAG: hypothetical protein Q8K60_02610, partial [Parachlamydiaceae bacterium]|nr:hypothetical protein [Parachlamydiaceae bacterium]
NPSIIKVRYEINEDFQEDQPQLSSLKTDKVLHFDYEIPCFPIQSIGDQPNNICWQISQNPDFNAVANHFNRIVSFSENITLNPIDETFLNPNETYYFRIKGQYDTQWSDWSPICEFTVSKPLNIEIIDFEKISQDTYELNWDRFELANENSIEYLIFGSNSNDFIPSIYYDKQINAISSDGVSEDEENDNLIAITNEPKFQIKKHEAFSYYRVIVRENGQLSIPSPIIHFYDHDLSLPRNVLQCTESDSDHFVAKRTLFPYQGSATEISILHAAPPVADVSLKAIIQTHIRSGKVFADAQLITKPCPSHIVQEAWDAVQPWLMPDNHPCKAKLDRLAIQKRFILNSKVMKQSGFPRADRVGRWSRVCASTHRDMQDYYFKIYHDCEIHIKYDWKRWVHRCEGAKLIRDCIRKNNLQSQFKVPRKWIYAWPENGQQAPSSSQYVAKNFLLVCDNMHICEHKENEKLYKNKVDKKRLKGLYIILQECGLYDSVYCFNMPFNKDGYICIIDTEYWHKWPVPFDRLSKSFSKEMKPYWQQLAKSKRIPDGVNSPNNLPRQDRRDHE